MTRMYYFPTHLLGMVSVEMRWLELLAGPASPAPAKDEPRPAVAVQLAAGAVQLLQCCNGVQPAAAPPTNNKAALLAMITLAASPPPPPHLLLQFPNN